jgi:ABC-type transporter Mla subunit MlaD
VPPAVVGQASITVTVEVNRTTTIPSDTRALGLIFGTFRMK